MTIQETSSYLPLTAYKMYKQEISSCLVIVTKM
jgi:hypothetical protein